MKGATAIIKKELRSYFYSPTAYVVLGIFLAIMGIIFAKFVAIYQTYNMQQRFGMSQGVTLDKVAMYLYQNMAFILCFVTPFLTMRLFAEEKRSGTIELLATSPVRDSEIILGKWLAALIMYASILAISALNIALLFLYGKPDWRPILVGYLGLILQGGALLAIGTFISTTTRNQIIAGTATFAACLLLWVFDWITAYETTTWAKVMSYLSVVTHFEPFAKGVLDTKHAIYYVSVIFFGLFLTARSMESLRWRA